MSHLIIKYNENGEISDDIDLASLIDDSDQHEPFEKKFIFAGVALVAIVGIALISSLGVGSGTDPLNALANPTGQVLGTQSSDSSSNNANYPSPILIPNTETKVSPTHSISSGPTANPTATPGPTSAPQATSAPTQAPTATPGPTVIPTLSPTPIVTPTDTLTPTQTP